MSECGFITNHGLVLAAVAKKPAITAREISTRVGITERTAHKIIKDLEAGGYITKTRTGRQNQYRIQSGMPIKEADGDAAVGDLLVILGWKREGNHNAAADKSARANKL